MLASGRLGEQIGLERPKSVAVITAARRAASSARTLTNCPTKRSREPTWSRGRLQVRRPAEVRPGGSWRRAATLPEGDIQDVPGGYDDEQIVEIRAHVALNVLTNYGNKSAGVEIDLPRVEPMRAAA